jgi:hypothetical protein
MAMTKNILDLQMIVCPSVNIGAPIDGLVPITFGHPCSEDPSDITWHFRAMVPVGSAQFLARFLTENVGHDTPQKSSIIGVEHPKRGN